MAGSVLERLAVLFGAACLKFVPAARLSDKMRSIEKSLLLGTDRRPLVNACLGKDTLQCLDVGARGGVQDIFKPYSDTCRFFLLEGEPTEAERLKKQGHIVIDSLIGPVTGQGVLNVTRQPGGSSTLEPAGHIMGFYAGRTDRFDVVQRIPLPMLSLDDIRAQQGEGFDFDYVKLDTQGSERDILRTSSSRPFFLETEVSAAHLYQNQGTVFEIGQLLYERGYLMADLSLRGCRPHPHGAWTKPGERPSLGIPLHGDARFMADWTRPAGREIIARSPQKWAALMLMFGQHEVARSVAADPEMGFPSALKAALGCGHG